MMHEFSLAAEIIEITEKSARSAGKSRITEIKLEIGVLSGVEENALYTALESLQADSMAKKAKILTITTEGKARCNKCKHEFSLTDTFVLCPNCHCYEKTILKGKEFNVLSIEAE